MLSRLTARYTHGEQVQLAAGAVLAVVLVVVRVRGRRSLSPGTAFLLRSAGAVAAANSERIREVGRRREGAPTQ